MHSDVKSLAGRAGPLELQCGFGSSPRQGHGCDEQALECIAGPQLSRSSRVYTASNSSRVRCCIAHGVRASCQVHEEPCSGCTDASLNLSRVHRICMQGSEQLAREASLCNHPVLIDNSSDMQCRVRSSVRRQKPS